MLHSRRGRAQQPGVSGELFISAKTASVHIPNILGELRRGPARGQAAAHRLGLFSS